MNDQIKVGELVYKISGEMGNLTTELKKAETEINKLKSAMDKSAVSQEKQAKGWATLGTAVKGFIAGFVVDRLLTFSKAAVAQAQQLLEQQTKLAQVLRVSQNATDEQIQSMFEYAEALEQVGIIDKEVILASQAQLATFDLSTESIKTLTPALLDYLAAEKGMNATTGDAIGLTNALAQAIQGNYGALSKSGFILDAETKKIIENGTQKERVQAITEVLESTYKDYNKTLLDQNPQKAFSRGIGNITESIGLAMLPAIQAVSGELVTMGGDLFQNGVDAQSWGKAFYRVAQGLLVIVRVLKEAFLGLKIAWNGVQNAFIGGAMAIVSGLRIAAKALGKETDVFDQALLDLKDSFNENLEDINDAGELSEENMQAMMKNIEGVFTASGFEAAAAKARTAFDETGKAVDAFGESTEDAADSSEKLQEKLTGVLEQLQKTKEALQGDLIKAFKEFNEAAGSELGDVNDTLAQTVLDAQDRIKELKEELRNIDGSDKNAGEDRSRLKAEIREQEEILKSRKGFEERQATFIQGIRDKLTAAGIDAEAEGLTSLTNIKSLEDKIKDERALRDLDDFAREEELAQRRLTLLTDNLIAEVSALREKITKQEELETELTNFLISQNALRKADVEAFANAAIAKYGEMAKALQSAISLQARLNAMRQASSSGRGFSQGGYTGSTGGVVHPNEYVIPSHMVNAMSGLVSQLEGIRTGRTTTISAPISLNAQINDRLDAQAVAKEIAWELGSR